MVRNLDILLKIVGNTINHYGYELVSISHDFRQVSRKTLHSKPNQIPSSYNFDNFSISILYTLCVYRCFMKFLLKSILCGLRSELVRHSF